jgi:hypothetical protein
VVPVEVVELSVRLHGSDAGLKGSGGGVWMAAAGREKPRLDGARERGVVPDGEWDSATYRRNHA